MWVQTQSGGGGGAGHRRINARGPYQFVACQSHAPPCCVSWTRPGALRLLPSAGSSSGLALAAALACLCRAGAVPGKGSSAQPCGCSGAVLQEPCPLTPGCAGPGLGRAKPGRHRGPWRAPAVAGPQGTSCPGSCPPQGSPNPAAPGSSQQCPPPGGAHALLPPREPFLGPARSPWAVSWCPVLSSLQWLLLSCWPHCPSPGSHGDSTGQQVPARISCCPRTPVPFPGDSARLGRPPIAGCSAPQIQWAEHPGEGAER